MSKYIFCFGFFAIFKFQKNKKKGVKNQVMTSGKRNI